jgi:uncharacterized protein
MSRFEWDAAKREETLRARSIDFADMARAFDRPMLQTLDERIEYGEMRWRALGIVNGRILMIVYTRREPDTIRIISARKASAKEIESYRAAYPEE